jgi:eukaryotic-like serine/threonine-protein kinase
VETVCSLLKRSRLVKAVQPVYEAWRRLEPRSSAGELGRFSKWLVDNHYVTGYQASQLLVGQADHFFLNHYKLLDLIGSGRMAGIFKAAHNLGQIVAIKVLPKSKSQDPKVLGRFMREAKMAVRLKHPNIVRTFHLGNAGGRHYIVMEHLEGETIADVLQRRKKLPYIEGVRLIHQALRAVQHIEEQGMVHRDLTPGNLMLVPPRPPGAPDSTLLSTLKVLDIGVGRLLFDENVKGDGENNQMLTTAGTLLGSAPYMAPEQARNAHAADVRADIYSLGCVLYQLLAGHPPFTGERDFDILLRHFSEPPQPIPDPSIPAGLQLVIGTMLAKDPKERYSPQKAAQALQPFLGSPEQQPQQASSLAKSYLHWVDTQPLEEVNNAPIAPERWYYSRGDLSIGPFPTAQLTQLALAGKLGPGDLLWMEGDNPDLAIPAKAAIDFAGLAGKTKTAAPAAIAARPQVPAARPVPPPPAATPAEMGYDPDTGQILDQAKFTKWQRQQREKQIQAPAGGLSVAGVFEKARVHVDRWLDFERNRRPIMAGDMEYIRKDPDIQRFMHYHARFGPDMLHKLWNHLQFMVENRRKYYCALG